MEYQLIARLFMFMLDHSCSLIASIGLMESEYMSWGEIRGNAELFNWIADVHVARSDEG